MRSVAVNVCDIQQGPVDLVETGLQTASLKQKIHFQSFAKNENHAKVPKPQNQTAAANNTDTTTEDGGRTKSKPRSYCAIDMQMNEDHMAVK